MVVTSIISIVSFSGMVLQDFRHFAVHWIWLALLFIAFVSEGIMNIPFLELIRNSLLNLCFLAVLFGLLTLVFSVIKRKPVLLTNEMIGWGDLLFFAVLAFGFSPVNFIVIFNILMILVLLFSLLYKIFKPGIRHIPLAGAMSLILILLFISSKIFSCSFKTFDDSEILTIIGFWYV